MSIDNNFTAKIPTSERKEKPKLESHSENLPPVFVEKPENKIIIEGGNDFVEAVVDGHPFPTITWYKGTRELTSDGVKYVYEADESTGIVGLTIKKAKSDDESKYTLKIQNESGEERATFSVFVKCIEFL